MPKILHNVREGILLQGRDLLSQSGYAQFSMREVASLCGIGVGTLYNYFPSKQSLVAEILNAEWDVYLRRMAQQAKGKVSPLEKLLRVYAELVGFMQGVHTAWISDYTEAESRETGEEGGAKCPANENIRQERDRVRDQLAAVVVQALEGEPAAQDAPWLADCAARLMLSYVPLRQAGADALGKALERLLR